MLNKADFLKRWKKACDNLDYVQKIELFNEWPQEVSRLILNEIRADSNDPEKGLVLAYLELEADKIKYLKDLVNESDVELVISQTNASKKLAYQAMLENGGDIVNALWSLT